MAGLNGTAGLPDGMLHALEGAYARPPRAYHHFGHVGDVLRHYQAVAEGPGWLQPREVRLAVLYHDAVYVPGRKDNEARSAALARAEIARWLPEAEVDADRVAELIELTARHGQLSPGDWLALAADTCHFLDCDISSARIRPSTPTTAPLPPSRGQVPVAVPIQRRRFLAPPAAADHQRLLHERF